MGIDRIGKPPAPVPPPGGSSPAAPDRAATFAISPTPVASPVQATPATQDALRPGNVAAASAASPGATPATGPDAAALDAVRAGSMPLSRYLDIKVEAATAHLSGLHPGQLHAIRAALRDRVATDPALSELFRTATGAVPPPADD